ncbi:hypothetical protein CASFOL_006475 [Castilleja foliolosa]|uniref:TF-B3 domain-containing protein n=1 Tax=Castilleja foliolosa TaxID=1961234 RepID=A0ABD3E7C1_9LAMI
MDTVYALNSGWATFLRIHRLKEGDRLLFYKFYQKSVCEKDCFYSLRLETNDGLAVDDPVVVKDMVDHMKRTLEMCALLETGQSVSGEDETKNDDGFSGGAN